MPGETSSLPQWSFGLVQGHGILAETAVNIGSGLVDAYARKLTFQQKNPAMVQFMLPLDSDDAALIGSDADLYVQAWRQAPGATWEERELKFYGPVWVDEIQGGEENSAMAVTALDASIYLARRFVSDQPFTTALDASVYAYWLTFLYGTETGLYPEYEYCGVDVMVDARDHPASIQSFFDQWTAMQDGPEIWVDAPDGYGLESGLLGFLHAEPRRGVDNVGVVFGYGPETVANCSSMTRSRDRTNLANRVTGYSDDETLASVTKIDTESETAYRPTDTEVTFPGVTDAITLAARTQGRLNKISTPTKLAEYKCSPNADAPRLFDDFGVGDTVTLHFRAGSRSVDSGVPSSGSAQNPLEWKVEQRVQSAVVNVDDNGFESLESLEFTGESTE